MPYANRQMDSLAEVVLDEAGFPIRFDRIVEQFKAMRQKTPHDRFRLVSAGQGVLKRSHSPDILMTMAGPKSVLASLCHSLRSLG